MPMDPPADLDQSGNYGQRQRVYLGPSVGWKDIDVNPPTLVEGVASYNVGAGDSFLFVNNNVPCTINLPDVSVWMGHTQGGIRYNAITGTERCLFIKDWAGTASVNNITVHPFNLPFQTIDRLVNNFVIVQNRQLLRLYPLNDLTGWMSG